ncbi:MAG TPA: hypothetical protein VMV32_08505 [Ignavibacteriaceae bacterium]|nr:hypothetical protein [Ignavibacteriaceae bacterium]
MKKPLITGYKGEIGSFLLSGLLRIMPKALDIFCVDVNESKEEVIERIKISDIIFVCVPMEKTIDWIMQYRNLLRNKIIVEQCSLKEWIYDDPRVRNFDIRSMHILFRPSQTPNLEDRKLGIFEGQFTGDMIQQLGDLTQSQIVWYKGAKEHDKEMAVQQALTHRTLLLLGNALKNCNGSTYISKRVLELSERIKKGNKDLYQLIQDNKYLPEQLEKIKEGFENFNLGDYWND